MTSDGAPADPRPTRSTRSGERTPGALAMYVLLTLAVVATVVMILTDDRIWMRVGILSALWSAFIGVALVSRYRRQAAAESARVRDLHTVYELQLEREISARREHELVVERDLRERVRTEGDDAVVALRQEIAALREQLAKLTGTPLGDDVSALAGAGAGAGRLPAPPARTSVPSERVERGERGEHRPVRGGSVPPRPAGRGEGRPSVRRVTRPEPSAPRRVEPREATPSQEQTRRIEPVVEGTRPPVEPAEDTGGWNIPWNWERPSGSGSTSTSTAGTARTASTAGTASTANTTGTANTAATPVSPAAPSASRSDWGERSGSAAVGRHERPAETTATDTSATDVSVSDTAADDTAADDTAADDARADDVHSRHGSAGGSSVAELMARLGAESGAASEAAPRRRRRAED